MKERLLQADCSVRPCDDTKARTQFNTGVIDGGGREILQMDSTDACLKFRGMARGFQEISRHQKLSWL